MYDFSRGPLVWIAFIVFFGGSIYRIVSTIMTAKKDKVVLPFTRTLDHTFCVEEYENAPRIRHLVFSFSHLSSSHSHFCRRPRAFVEGVVGCRMVGVAGFFE